ncbi:MAG TPA: helix-turn-helix domain-containing protein [Gemmatimonadales bacterium]|jgi:predicted ArsR family transcriptional regulator|nr:helix-turn-helix domain-containing protein [Gemmatimonadales bacterium]
MTAAPDLPQDHLPLGLKGPRAAVVMELKRAPGMEAKDLARRLSLSMNAIRHHLKELEASGVVEWSRRPSGGPGAPGHAYHLTAAGEALFPERYKETLTQLMEHLVATSGRAAAVEFIESHYRALAEQLEPELAVASPAERMRIVARVRSEDGYMAEGAATFCCGTLTEHHCALRAVSERFPEICDAEQRFLERTLGGRIERRLHLLSGDGACEYSVRFRPSAGGAVTGQESA